MPTNASARNGERFFNFSRPKGIIGHYWKWNWRFLYFTFFFLLLCDLIQNSNFFPSSQGSDSIERGREKIYLFKLSYSDYIWGGGARARTSCEYCKQRWSSLCSGGNIICGAITQCAHIHIFLLAEVLQQGRRDDESENRGKEKNWKKHTKESAKAS